MIVVFRAISVKLILYEQVTFHTVSATLFTRVKLELAIAEIFLISVGYVNVINWWLAVAAVADQLTVPDKSYIKAVMPGCFASCEYFRATGNSGN